MNDFIKSMNHLALVIDDIEKGKWYFGKVLNIPYKLWRDSQILMEIGDSILIAKLSKDAVDKERQKGTLQKQAMDHYGFKTDTRENVDRLYKRVADFGLKIIKEPYDRSDGRAFYFRDPFGNLVEYFWYNVD